ncbi:MAG: DUF2125 domain-containing protein [Devosiaceae bacterium]|nr:DUF2125 domain-containing protein [Devosiaceae bacterium]
MNRFILLLIFIIILIAGWTGAWFFAANKLKTEAMSFFSASEQSDQIDNCQKFDVAGFPFRFDVTCTNFSFNQLDMTVSLPELKATVLVYRPTHFLLFAEGPLSIDDSFSGSSREVQWDSLRASLRTSAWTLTRFSLQGENLSLYDNLLGKTLIAATSLFEFHLLDDAGEKTTEANLHQLQALAKIKNATAPEFNINNANLDFEARIADMPDDLRLWTPKTIAHIWNQNQTGVTISKFTGRDELSEFSINGQITTTAQAMLSGNFDFFSTNLSPRFAGILDPNSTQVIFGNQSDDGSFYQSYALVHGVLLAGNLPILTFSPMR